MYDQVFAELHSLLEDTHPWVTVLSTTVCTLHHHFSHFHWTGFYMVSEPEVLSVGPYQGGHGCLRIPFSQGVCGAAARTQHTQWVRDVHARADHIACSSTTNSEVVIPVFHEGIVVAVLDVDSDIPDAFSQDDVDFLERVCQFLGTLYPSSHPS